MQSEPKQATNGNDDNRFGGFGCFVCLVIALIIGWGLIKSTYEVARWLNILLHPSAFASGVAEGFRKAIHINDSVVIYLAVPVITLSATLFAAGAATLAFALAIASIRARSPRVFISYHHSMQMDARALQHSLNEGGFEALFVPFVTAAEHDKLLDTIYGLIKRSHFVVCLPGPVPSFVEGEVASAISHKKPVFFLLAPGHGGIPNAAQHSYPVLRLDRLRDTGFSSLLRLLHYLHGSFLSTLQLYFTPTRLPSLVRVTKSGLSYGIGMLVWSYVMITILGNLRALLMLSAKVEGFLWGTFFGSISIAIPVWLSMTYACHFAIGGVITLRARNIALRQTRRMLRDGSYSYEVLRGLFRPTKGLLTLLRPFFRHAQLSYHEIRAQET